MKILIPIGKIEVIGDLMTPIEFNKLLQKNTMECFRYRGFDDIELRLLSYLNDINAPEFVLVMEEKKTSRGISIQLNDTNGAHLLIIFCSYLNVLTHGDKEQTKTVEMALESIIVTMIEFITKLSA